MGFTFQVNKFDPYEILAAPAPAPSLESKKPPEKQTCRVPNNGELHHKAPNRLKKQATQTRNKI